MRTPKLFDMPLLLQAVRYISLALAAATSKSSLNQVQTPLGPASRLG